MKAPSLMKAPCLRMHLRKLKPLAPSLRTPKAKAQPEKATQLPAPGKEVWKDVHHQVMKQAKAGESKLRNAWEKAKAENGPSKQNVSFTIMFSCLTPMSAKSNATRQAWKGSNRLKKLCLDG